MSGQQPGLTSGVVCCAEDITSGAYRENPVCANDKGNLHLVILPRFCGRSSRVDRSVVATCMSTVSWATRLWLSMFVCQRRGLWRAMS